MPNECQVLFGVLTRVWRFVRASPGLGAVMALTLGAAGSSAELTVTNVAQLRDAAAHDPPAAAVVHLEGNVWWVSMPQHRLVLQDASGAAELEMHWTGASVHAGQRIRLQGKGPVTRRGAGF